MAVTKKKRRSFAVDFYRVTPFEGCSDFPAAASALATRNKDEICEHKHNRTPVKHIELHVDADYVCLDMMRLRTDSVATKATPTTKPVPVLMGAGEDLSEQAAFVYHRRSRVLVAQRAQYGVTLGALQAYVEKFGPTKLVIEAAIHPDALARLAGFTSLSRLELSLAGLDKTDIFNNTGHEPRGLAMLAKDMGAPSISVELSVGRSRGELSREGVVRLATSLLGLRSQGASVTRLAVSGSTESMAREVLNLTRAQLTDKVTLDLDARNGLPHTARWDAMKDVLNARMSYLGEIFRF